MVTLLITSVLLLSLIAIAIYFWQKPAKNFEHEQLHAINPQSLFDVEAPAQLTTQNAITESITHRSLLTRATEGDRSALLEAHQTSRQVYDEVLNGLLTTAQQGPQLLSLVSFVTRHELPVTKNLANRFMESWQENADRGSTAKMLHIAALSDDADTYRRAVESVLRFWRSGKLSDLTRVELQALLNGEFWVLSSGSRNSGAGFILKRILSSARRELEQSTTN